MSNQSNLGGEGGRPAGDPHTYQGRNLEATSVRARGPVMPGEKLAPKTYWSVLDLLGVTFRVIPLVLIAVFFGLCLNQVAMTRGAETERDAAIEARTRAEKERERAFAEIELLRKDRNKIAKGKQGAEADRDAAVAVADALRLQRDAFVDRAERLIGRGRAGRGSSSSGGDVRMLIWCLGGDYVAKAGMIIRVDLSGEAIPGWMETILPILEIQDRLQWLSLDGTGVSDAQLGYLGGVSTLQDLSLANNKGVSDKGLAQLVGLRDLHTLSLNNTGVGDDGLRHVAELKKLHTLNLGSTKVSDKGLKHLKALLKLRSLSVDKTNVTTAGAADLEKAVPDLKVSR